MNVDMKVMGIKKQTQTKHRRIQVVEHKQQDRYDACTLLFVARDSKLASGQCYIFVPSWFFFLCSFLPSLYFTIFILSSIYHCIPVPCILIRVIVRYSFDY
jgi:hypothetical protein